MGEWDLVIFDNDGVLVDSERLGNQVLARTLTELGYPISFDECVRRFMGGTLVKVRSLVEEDLGKRLPGDFEATYQDRLFETFRTELRAVAGVQDALDVLERASIPVCVASSGRPEKIRMSLTHVGLVVYFEGRMFSAQDVERSKPAPDLFLHAASSCGAAPERCLVVEDSPAGVAGAKAAGMTVVGHVSLVPSERLFEAGADLVLDSMAGLPEAMTQLTSLPASDPSN
jgi:HAD superfamily hydrolase (TIGR01509 family)